MNDTRDLEKHVAGQNVEHDSSASSHIEEGGRHAGHGHEHLTLKTALVYLVGQSPTTQKQD
jgi:hypothetical protein